MDVPALCSYFEANGPFSAEKPLCFTYTNHAGAESIRTVIPEHRSSRFVVERFVFPEDFRHADNADGEPRWTLHAFDLDRKARRSFRIDHIHTIL